MLGWLEREAVNLKVGSSSLPGSELRRLLPRKRDVSVIVLVLDSLDGSSIGGDRPGVTHARFCFAQPDCYHIRDSSIARFHHQRTQ